MAIFILRKLILQTCMCSQPVGLDVWFVGGPFIYFFIYFMCANREGSGETAQMLRLTWAFAGRPCDKYHNLMSWLIYSKSYTILAAKDKGANLTARTSRLVYDIETTV